MTTEQIALASVAATLIVGIVSWLLSAAFAKKSLSRKELNFKIEAEQIIQATSFEARDLKIEYKNEVLANPVVLSVEVTNTGNVSLVKPPIEIRTHNMEKIVPGFFEGVPPGYEGLWKIVGVDAHTCRLELEHINPGQTLRARFLLDKIPDPMPSFVCAMQDLRVKKAKPYKLNAFVETLLRIFEPSLLATIRRL